MMTPAELKQYAHILLDAALEQHPGENVLALLERHVPADELEQHKVTAISCVRVRNNIDERLRQHRERAAEAA